MKHLRDAILGLQAEYNTITKRQADIKVAIEKMQAVCEHEYATVDDTPHYVLEICKNCTHERRI